MTGTCNVSIYVTRSKSLYSPIRLPPSFPPSFSLSFFHPPSIGRLLSQYRVCVYKLSGPRIHINHGCWSCAFHDAPHACIHPSSFLFIRPLSLPPHSSRFRQFLPPLSPFFHRPKRKRESLDHPTHPLPSCPVTNSPGIKYIPVVQRPNSRSSSSSLPPPPLPARWVMIFVDPVISARYLPPSLLVSPYFVSPSFSAFYPSYP